MNLKALRNWISNDQNKASTADNSGHKQLGNLLVPLFIYPNSAGLASWNRVGETIRNCNLQESSFVVINPDNGDFGLQSDELASIGSSDERTIRERINPEFARACQILESNNIKTLGYVYTNYGLRPIDRVRDRIELYKTIYRTDGILLDEMAREKGSEEYYSSLTSFTKDIGMSRTIGNPGTSVEESYVKTVDTLVIYEMAGYPDLARIEERTFYGTYSPEKFGVVLHSLLQYSPDWVKKASKFVSHFYLTQAVPPNPYDRLSEYLDVFASDLSGK